MYQYTFTKGTQVKLVIAINFINACELLGLNPTVIEKLSDSYLASTPFNQRERHIWCGNDLYYITQNFNKTLT